ncbi:OmpH family outer membrane protein [Niabella yanshanensis]|uniref:OmpH family outer membrane protein n=1 Tax=Niabella yanshanensis TaxID=577386 RepID=A0ABZ0W1U9_9BACT|nr:OmpH family outer membrane protein [Niabella yanshanensis]WQD36894.1 OmpH family outer membrane protein [Niabella yanshanensis]
MNVFKKLQLRLKAKSKAQYKELKKEYKELLAYHEELRNEFEQKKQQFIRNYRAIKDYDHRREEFVKRSKEVLPPLLEFPVSKIVNVKHSGQLGDLIYSIPAMKALSGEQGIRLYLPLDQPITQESYWSHPLGNVMLNSSIYKMAEPLLTVQPIIHSCDTYQQQHIDIDLDIFRKLPWNHHKGHISRWHFLYYPGGSDLSKQWLYVPAIDPTAKNGIVICRSQRYNAPGIDYSFLKKYPEVYFLGVENEYRLLKQSIPNLTYLPVKDFLQMASIIAGAKLFIGNQSAPFAMAEGLKVNRLLETYFDCPNVIIEGDTGFEFCYQPQFEELVKRRYEKL